MNDEADEFRKGAHAIRLKYHPELNVMHHEPSYVTRDDLQSFQSILANEISMTMSGGAPKLYDCPLQL